MFWTWRTILNDFHRVYTRILIYNNQTTLFHNIGNMSIEERGRAVGMIEALPSLRQIRNLS